MSVEARDSRDGLFGALRLTLGSRSDRVGIERLRRVPQVLEASP
jgi:hypothetical protein